MSYVAGATGVVSALGFFMGRPCFFRLSSGPRWRRVPVAAISPPLSLGADLISDDYPH
jgi:hypothetical protein